MIYINLVVTGRRLSIPDEVIIASRDVWDPPSTTNTALTSVRTAKKCDGSPFSSSSVRSATSRAENPTSERLEFVYAPWFVLALTAILTSSDSIWHQYQRIEDSMDAMQSEYPSFLNTCK